MREIVPYVEIGGMECCEVKEGFSLVHGCKHPCHAGRSKRVLKLGDVGYYAQEEGHQLFLNIIDPPTPLFAKPVFDAFLSFARREWVSGRGLRIHCNKGESRAPSLALLFLAKVLHTIPDSSYDEAYDEFEKLCPEYQPGLGIEEWLRTNWPLLAADPVAYIRGSAPVAPVAVETPPEMEGLSAEDALDMVRGSPLAHFSGFVTIEDKKHERIEPVPNILQVRIAEAYEWCLFNGVPPRLQILKPRQVGSSTFTGHLCYHHARRFRVDGMIIGDEASRTEKVWQIFREYADNDFFPWDSSVTSNTEKCKFWYADSSLGLWEHDTANDPKAGISGTRQVIWYTEPARYSKTGARTDAKVITASLNSLAKVPYSLAVAESTADGACYDEDTEILTDQGWKLFRDLTGNEQILSKDRKTGVAYYEPFWQKQVHHYRGPMVKIRTRTVNLRVTPNHMMWCARQKGVFKMQAARTMLATRTDFYFDRAMIWAADGAPDFSLPSYRHRQGAGWRTIPEKTIQIDVWLKFLGYWLSDGHVTFVRSNKCVALTQVKFPDEFRAAALAMANALGGLPLRDVPHGNGRRFIIESAQLASYLVNFSKPKRIPRDLLMRMTQAQCRDLMEAIYLGDGDQDRRNKDGCDQGKIYCGIDREFQDDVQELALKCGYATSAYGPANNRRATFTESIKATAKYDNPPVEEPGYDGEVYCVTIPRDHLLMVRRGGTAVWCGNSGWFYENWGGAATLEGCRSGDYGNGWIKIFAAWFEFAEHNLERKPSSEKYFAGELSKSEKRGVELYGWTPTQIAWRRAQIENECGKDERVFMQDYPENDVDCFLSSGRPRFDLDGMTRLETMAKAEHALAERGTLEEEEGVINFEVREDDAWLWVKERPKIGCAYIAFIDPCTGAQSAGARNPDAHAAGIIRDATMDENKNIRPPELVAVIDVPLGCRWDDSLIAQRMARLAEWYGGCMIVPETGNGLGVLVKLQDYGANIYRREKLDADIPGQYHKVLGWETNKATRDIVVNAMADAIRERENGFNCCYLPAVKEMRTFVINDRGKAEAKPGCHDDWPMGIGIGLANLHYASVYRPMKNHGRTGELARQPSGAFS